MLALWSFLLCVQRLASGLLEFIAALDQARNSGHWARATPRSFAVTLADGQNVLPSLPQQHLVPFFRCRLTTKRFSVTFGV